MKHNSFGLLRCVILVSALCVPLAGCGSVGILASSPKTFALEDSVVLKRPTPNYFDAATDVAKSLGFEVAGISRADNEIAFVKGANEFTTIMIGKMERVTVDLTLAKDQKSIAINVKAMGNFDAASQAAVSKIVDDFKAGLTAKLAA
jgi:hypothetical protein